MAAERGLLDGANVSISEGRWLKSSSKKPIRSSKTLSCALGQGAKCPRGWPEPSVHTEGRWETPWGSRLGSEGMGTGVDALSPWGIHGFGA